MPLLWTILEKAGCLSTAERSDLMQRFLTAFPGQKVASFASDREFIDNDRKGWLHDNGVLYVLRLRDEMKGDRRGTPASLREGRILWGQEIRLKIRCSEAREASKLPLSVRRNSTL